jgi:hypothetical protein
MNELLYFSRRRELSAQRVLGAGELVAWFSPPWANVQREGEASGVAVEDHPICGRAGVLYSKKALFHVAERPSEGLLP